jgi:hypothetical protein
MLQKLFANVMTVSDDRTHWGFAYVVSAAAEALAVLQAYKSLCTLPSDPSPTHFLFSL